MPKRVLVLGATGMLGHEAVRTLAEDFEVHATARDVQAATKHISLATLHPLDADRPEDVPKVLESARPEVVLNCIGIVKQRPEATEPVVSISVNSLFPHQLAAVCAQHGVRLIHVSTDCVFSGRLPAPSRYREDDPTDADDLYGRSKLLGEVTDQEALTLRTSIIGWELSRSSGLLEWFVSHAGARVTGYVNAVFSGLTTAALSRVVGRVVTDFPDLRGLYHVSAEPIGKYDLLEMLNDVLALGCSIEAADDPRINRALDSSRFQGVTGIGMPAWDEMLRELPSRRP